MTNYFEPRGRSLYGRFRTRQRTLQQDPKKGGEHDTDRFIFMTNRQMGVVPLVEKLANEYRRQGKGEHQTLHLFTSLRENAEL